MNQQVRVEHGSPSSSNTTRIQIGDVCCAISCDNAEIFNHLREVFTNFFSEAPVDLTIDLKIVNGLSTEELVAALTQNRAVQKGNHLASTHLTLDKEFDLNRRLVNIVAERNLFNPDYGFKFVNRLIPEAYFTACTMKYDSKPPAMVVHGCGIVRNGVALVFTGPPETGKTTVARLCGDEYGHVLNDEMVLVSWPDDGQPFKVQGMPIIGGVSQRLNEVAPLSCILMLKQSDKTSLRRLAQKEAYLRFMRQVISPTSIMRKENTRELLLLTTWFSDDLAKNAAFYEMEFNLDRELFWKKITDLEEALGKEVSPK